MAILFDLVLETVVCNPDIFPMLVFLLELLIFLLSSSFDGIDCFSVVDPLGLSKLIPIFLEGPGLHCL